MEIIKRAEMLKRYRAECSECLTVVEGKYEEFQSETSMNSSWHTFICPVCKVRQVARRDFWYENDGLRLIRYRINEDGTKGEEIE